MATAYCFSCAAEKPSPIASCGLCKKSPMTEADLVRSLILSDEISTHRQLAHFVNEVQSNLGLTAPDSLVAKARTAAANPTYQRMLMGARSSRATSSASTQAVEQPRSASVPNPTPKRGFAGLETLLSDLSVEVGADDLVPTKPPPTEATAPPSTPPDLPHNGRATSAQPATPRPAPAPPASGGTGPTNWWPIAFGIAVLAAFGLGMLGERSRRTSPTVDSNASAGSAPSPSFGEDRPGVGTDNLLSATQLNYCLAEAIRLEGMRDAVGSDNSKIDVYNAAVADSNSRCGSYRYYEDALQAARSRVEEVRAALLIEGQVRLQFVGISTQTSAQSDTAGVPSGIRAPTAADDPGVPNTQASPDYPPLRPAEIYSSFRSGVDSLRYFAAEDTIELGKMTLTSDQREQIDALVAAATAGGEFSYADARGIDVAGDKSLELLVTKNSGGTLNIQDADVYQIRSEEPIVRPMFQFPSGYGHVSFLRFDGRPGLHVASTLQGFRYQFGSGVNAVYSTSVAEVDGIGLIPAPEIMTNPIIVYCAGKVAQVGVLDSAQCLSAWDAAQAELISKFEQARNSRVKGSGDSKNWDNLMVAATHLLQPLINSGLHEQADAYLQKIWPSDDQTSLREFRDRYWGAIDKEILVGEASK
ncbi:MAG: hypothetical protein IPO95_08610 [Rhodanobacteraceae bacterium]|nr:hypothetical protein [Rhodanobacteraceae bacterium]